MCILQSIRARDQKPNKRRTLQELNTLSKLILGKLLGQCSELSYVWMVSCCTLNEPSLHESYHPEKWSKLSNKAKLFFFFDIEATLFEVNGISVIN